MIAAPLGYQIRLKILDFNVPGITGICKQDSLHILNHENSIDPEEFDRTSESQRHPGPIIGNLCGSVWNQNQNQTIISTQNALTLWWHTDETVKTKSEESGFRILWSAFRKPTDDNPCLLNEEFQCSNMECIPSNLACNSKLDGPRKLLFCLAIVTVGVLVCCAICSVFYFLMPDCLKTKKSTSKPFSNAAESLIQRPPIPNFAPPSQGIPNVIISDYSKLPKNIQNAYIAQYSGIDQITNTTTTMKSTSNPSARTGCSYYILPVPPATPAPSDYAYIQTDPNIII
ncbi:hypothetical protein FO519_001422 [Halicephalobus sp. NKZ332]|nr:hypothetical protein FO519_001422 [Halicephalobus sp. NKZ332]